MIFEPTNCQDIALKQMKMWYKLISSAQQFILFGYAGTGKTTIIRHFIEQIGLDIKEEVKFVAYTGKAALVMHNKGLPATTIHKLIYNAVDEEYETTNAKGEKVIKTRIKFVKKPALDDKIKLIIADECSMISQQLWDDLLTFNIPIIVLGDSGQLPPVKGTSPFENVEPDAFLDEVVRQAADNPIIYLATLARQGKPIRYGNYGNNVQVLNANMIQDQHLINSDIVITTTNDLRDELNAYIRQIKGFHSKLPEINDKLICRKNDWQAGTKSCPLVNGLIGYNTEIIEISNNNKTFSMSFRPEISKTIMDLDCNVEIFNAKNNKERQEICKNRYSKGQMFEFGYAITTHLSQGSEYKNATLYYIPFGDSLMKKRLLYTGITRAQNILTLYM